MGWKNFGKDKLKILFMIFVTIFVNLKNLLFATSAVFIVLANIK